MMHVWDLLHSAYTRATANKLQYNTCHLENDTGVFKLDGQRQKWIVLRSTWNGSNIMYLVLKHYLTFANIGHYLEDKESDAEDDTEDEGNPEERQQKSNKKRWRGGHSGPSGS